MAVKKSPSKVISGIFDPAQTRLESQPVGTEFEFRVEIIVAEDNAGSRTRFQKITPVDAPA
jgi:hypothetical protein